MNELPLAAIGRRRWRPWRRTQLTPAAEYLFSHAAYLWISPLVEDDTVGFPRVTQTFHRRPMAGWSFREAHANAWGLGWWLTVGPGAWIFVREAAWCAYGTSSK
ncbi:hypothetical protein B0H11DRAFT_2276238 [Mycena galericulata]|nr:hypothetical protein B0H11DRAFT_2276238 [Mycena galericulata]